MRIKANKKNPYIMVHSKVIEDNSLSFGAKGLFCFILSQPYCWKPSTDELLIDQLLSVTTEDPEEVHGYLDELLREGYVVSVLGEG